MLVIISEPLQRTDSQREMQQIMTQRAEIKGFPIYPPGIRSDCGRIKGATCDLLRFPGSRMRSPDLSDVLLQMRRGLGATRPWKACESSAAVVGSPAKELTTASSQGGRRRRYVTATAKPQHLTYETRMAHLMGAQATASAAENRHIWRPRGSKDDQPIGVMVWRLFTASTRHGRDIKTLQSGPGQRLVLLTFPRPASQRTLVAELRPAAVRHPHSWMRYLKE